MSRFKVGQKIICIYSEWPECKAYGLSHPIKDEICEVDGFFEARGNTYLHLVGYKQIAPDGNRIDFNSKRFAPIEEYTDSLSIAESLVKELGEVDKAKEPLKELA